MRGKGTQTIEAGDRLVLHTPGGGGFGDPEERDPQRVRIDIENGLVSADGVASEAGRARASKALLDEKRWEIIRADQAMEGAAALYDGMRALETVLTSDQIAEVDAKLAGPEALA